MSRFRTSTPPRAYSHRSRFGMTLVCLIILPMACRHLESSSSDPTTTDLSGRWIVCLDTPGGILPFGLELAAKAEGYEAWLHNGEERIAVRGSGLVWDGERFELPIEPYESRLEGRMSSPGVLEGIWRKRGGPAEWTRMTWRAERSRGTRFAPLAAATAEQDRGRIDGKWRVKFSQSEEPAVAVFASTATGELAGTFMTTTGDYRYLAGSLEGSLLRLSCFDGAHAFLFHASLGRDGKLAGDFWSRDNWHETWTAVRDAKACLPDAFSQTAWTGRVGLEELVFPDLGGRRRSLADPAFAGRARILQIFGSWCPNCQDAGELMSEFHRRFSSEGLSIVGLAFEHAEDFDENVVQVRRYAERHETAYPLLIAGPSDKKLATERLRALDYIRSFPTTVFLHADGRVRAIHSGFTGPATKSAFIRMKSEFEDIIRELLAE